MKQIFAKHHRKFFGIMTIIGCYILVSCGPIYSTEYTFQPPLSPEGKTCILQCENSKLQCRQMEKMREENCLLRSALECEDQKECSKSLCSKDDKICEEIYRNCYQVCGGTVNTQKVCILNCNK